jgi:hypothetical protein
MSEQRIKDLEADLADALAECDALRDQLADCQYDLLEANKARSAAAALLGASVPDSPDGA